jgi:hypothetical protein
MRMNIGGVDGTGIIIGTIMIGTMTGIDAFRVFFEYRVPDWT